jgi:hypothetical protein
MACQIAPQIAETPSTTSIRGRAPGGCSPPAMTNAIIAMNRKYATMIQNDASPQRTLTRARCKAASSDASTLKSAAGERRSERAHSEPPAANNVSASVPAPTISP